MASTHKHIRSSTADKRPTTAIADGQIAINTEATSPGLFFKDSTGATIIKVGPVHVGTTAPNATPAAGGSSGNSTGEVWLDTSLTPPGVKIWSGGAWTNATPIGSTTVQGLLELATDAETQAGADTARAVTPAGLQSKVSDSTSTTSSTTIASSTAVKSAYDLASAALPASGGTVTGTVTFGTTSVLAFEGSTDDGFETALAVVNPTADRTITLPNVSGTVVTTGDTGTVTSTMIADGTIVNADINASAAIALSKLATGALPTAITVASANIVDGTIVDADINASAGIALSKLATGALPSAITVDNTNIVDGSISNADINAAAGIALSKLATGALPTAITVASANIVDGTIVNADINAAAAIDKTKISGTAITAGDTGTVTSTMIADGTIVNGDINASAGIAHSKLASITAGQVLLGDAANVATATALSGDVTVNSSGVTAIGSGVIVNADINASAAIADTKLATISTAGKVSNSATTATDANTASAIVARDASGNFSAGTITASLSGSATSAATLTTARTINGVSFNGSADINIPDLRGSNGTVIIDGIGVTSAVNYVELTNAATAGTVTLSTNGTDTNIPLQITTKGTGAVSIATAGGNIALRPTTGAVLLYDATNTYYTNLENGTLTANRTLTMPNGDVTLTAGTMVPTTGTGATGTWGISVTGNAATATTLATARTINGTSFNGSANITTASWGTARSLWGQSVDGSANVTGPLYPAAGSVSAPAFSTSGDTNTGVYFPAADTIGFSVGGAIGAGIDSDGNLQLYNSAGTFYHNFAGQPTANRTITLPDASVTLVSGTMVPTTGTGATGSWGISVTGNAATATTLATARTINGTSFNGSANITTASWGTARTFTFAGDVSGSTAGVDGAANETFTLSLAAASVSAAQMDGGQSGSAPVSGVRGWVNFDGSVTTPTIRASNNVTSITDLGGWGEYRVNWTTAMPNVNYAACVTSAFWNNDGYGSARSSVAATTAYYYLVTYNPTVGNRDSNYISVMAIV